MMSTVVENRVRSCCAGFIILAIGLAFICIPGRLFVRKIIYERFGIYNKPVQFWLQNDSDIEQDYTYDAVKVDWEKQYPFATGDRTSRGCENSNNWDAEEKTVRGVSDDRLSGHRGLQDVSGFISGYLGRTQSLKKHIEQYAGDLFLFHLQAKVFVEYFNRLIGYNEDGNIQMLNGYWTDKRDALLHRGIVDAADSVKNFADYLRERQIGFLYVNVGEKVCPYNRQMRAIDIELERSNENADLFLGELEARGVDVVDFREEIKKSGQNWYDFYYVADHHWTTKAGLWAAGVLADKLNDSYGFSFDDHLFQSQQYKVEHYADFWLGSEGRGVTTARAPMDDFDLILPKFETDFSVEIPTWGKTVTGSYEDQMDMVSLSKIKLYDSMDYYRNIDPYTCSYLRNDALVHIRNNRTTNNDGKKLLMIQDSFSFYSTTFLALDIAEMDVITLSEFTGSIRSYVDQTQPDMVIVMYGARNIQPVDESVHTGTLDFR